MSLDKKVLSLAKFSRWLRTICTILLSRNASADRAKALNYIEQAVNVMENSTGIAINGDTVDNWGCKGVNGYLALTT